MKFLKAFFILFFLVVAAQSFAQSSADLKKQRDQLNQQIEKLNQDLQQTSKNKKLTLRQLNLIKAQIALREAKINNINSQIRLLDNQISDNTNVVHGLQSQLSQLKKEYAAMVLFAFRNQSAYNKLMFIFVSHDFNQAYKRLKYLQQIGDYRQRQAAYIGNTDKQLGQKISELDRNKREKSTLLADQEKEKKTLGVEKENQAKVVVDLSQHLKQVKQEVALKQRTLGKINRALTEAINKEIQDARRAEAARIAAEDKAASVKARAENRPVAPASRKPAKTTTELLTSTPEAAKLSSDFLSNKGRLPWPVANMVAVIRDYGVFYTEGIKDENKCINIKTQDNAQVRAVFEGEVVKVNDIYGSFIVMVRHGEYFTAYSNLRSVNVSKGQKVSTKQNIGIAATDPATGDTEVDFWVYKGDKDMNPRNWLVPN